MSYDTEKGERTKKLAKRVIQRLSRLSTYEGQIILVDRTVEGRDPFWIENHRSVHQDVQQRLHAKASVV